MGEFGVWSLLEDSHGNIWFGSPPPGLSKFDGTSWSHYSIHSDAGLFEDSHGNIWASSNFGTPTSKFDGSTWENFNIQTCAINEDDSGKIWAATKTGIYTLNDTTWSQVSLPGAYTNYPFYSLVKDSLGNLWFGTKNCTVLKYDQNNWTIYDSIIPGWTDNITRIFLDSRNKLWFLTGSPDLFNYDGINWQKVQVFDNCFNSSLYSMAEDKQGNYWFPADNILYKYDGTNWSYFQENRFIIEAMFTILIDHNDNIWTGEQFTFGGAAKLEIINIKSNYYHCTGLDSGVITINTPALSPPLKYSLDSGQTYSNDSIFTNVSPGTYYVAVKNNTETIYNSTPVSLYKDFRIWNNLNYPSYDTASSVTMDTCGDIILDAGAGYNSYLWSNGSECPQVDLHFSSGGTYKYSVTVTDNLCQYKDSVSIIVFEANCITGIIQHDNNSIKIYPNPVTNDLQILSDVTIKNIDVTDITGRLLCNTNSKTIDCRSFASGVYFIRATTDKGVVVKKFIKE